MSAFFEEEYYMIAEQELFAPGHNACPGCGAAIATRLILRATGANVIVVSSTGCLETFSAVYDSSCWEVPWIHPAFENAGAVASGIEAGLKVLGKTETNVVAIGGDGGTYDIGIGSLSGMLERGHKVTFICYDNEGYMNTGVQRSSSTPYGATTTTTPQGTYSFGEDLPKKNLPAIVSAHEIPYVATATIGYPRDLMNKVKKSLTINGPRFILVFSPCPIGWGVDPALTIKVSKLAVQTGLFPLYEVVDGKQTKVMKTEPKPVQDFLMLQKRYQHLFNHPEGEKHIAVIEEMADRNIELYGMT
jgi:pyruvate ferredoxin oxidoreductase beta subunit